MKTAMELGRVYSTPFGYNNMKKFWNWFYSKPIALLVLLGSSAATSIGFISWIFSQSSVAIIVTIAAAVIMITYMTFAIAYDARNPLR
jgi:hypothetical protein